MKFIVAAVVVVVLVWSPQLTSGQTQFVPPVCRDLCKNGYKDVSSALDDFLKFEGSTNGTQPKFAATRASTWAVTLLRVVSPATATATAIGAGDPACLELYTGTILYAACTVQNKFEHLLREPGRLEGPGIHLANYTWLTCCL